MGRYNIKTMAQKKTRHGVDTVKKSLRSCQQKPEVKETQLHSLATKMDRGKKYFEEE